MGKTTFALIGLGVVGERIINQILNHDSSEIIAVYDENKERLEEVAAKYQLPVAENVEGYY